MTQGAQPVLLCDSLEGWSGWRGRLNRRVEREIDI